MNNSIIDEARIDAFLSRGVENVFPSKEFVKAKLMAGKPLTMYLGIDPTGPSLHLGHAIVLKKMREFQDLGHKLILLIGDFTGMIGDPTDKSAARKRQTRNEVLANAKLYKSQASKIIRFSGSNAAELKYNSKWLAKMSFEEVVELTSHFTVQQMLERDMFERRVEDGRPVNLHEFLYPLMQGYDSVALGVDGEIGGNDQTFNMLVGRTLMKEMLGKEKFVITMKLLVDPTGKKMGKSEGNMITLEDSPSEMFGKVMSWTDEMIRPGFEILTNVPMEEIVVAENAGTNPRDLKDRLAREIVSFFFNKEEAAAAAEGFKKMFQAKEAPEEMVEFKVNGKKKIIDVLAESGIVESKSEARRQIEHGGVKVDGRIVSDINIEVSSGAVIQKGKRHFIRII